MLCITNMILHGIDVPINIKHDNTLARPLRDYIPGDRVISIVTNPILEEWKKMVLKITFLQLSAPGKQLISF